MAVTQLPARRAGGASPGRARRLDVATPAGPRSGLGRPTAKPRTRARGTFLAGVLLASLVVFGLVLVNIALAQSSFELADLQRQVVEQQARGRELRYQVARAESPERIATVAAELGLVPPEREEYLQGPAVLVSVEKEPRADAAGYELSTARR
jgi:cell division protein FtsL